MLRTGFIIAFSCLLLSCSVKKTHTPEPTPADRPPSWARNAIWYQIFVERFRNGDPANDPALQDIEGSWPHIKPENWKPAVWTSDFYEQSAWEKSTGKDFYTTVQLRRYGGDFQGVLDKLDYLKDLGITAVYFNPLNDAPSLHKYDARNFHHMDRNFGPDPAGDEALIATEVPSNPATWKWTAADRQFLEIVEEAHARGIRVIVDFSWNHTGIHFWAWQDILKNGRNSPYAGWYEIESFDDPATTENEFKYRGWAGVPELPELKKTGRPEGQTHGAIPGNLVDPVKKHVFDVTRRWMDPDGDGNTADGIDGFRLDVAEMVPLDFWRDYRKFVRSINPDAFLIGEIWWEKWPEKMLDPKPWLAGDVFDAVMHYRWFKPVRSFFARPADSIHARSFALQLDSVVNGIPFEMVEAMMNLTASHDTERFSTSFLNKNRYKFHAKPSETTGYNIGSPDDRTLQQMKLALIHQFTWDGSPHIWNGDEFGMWGSDDPENRKPLIWPDLTFADEKSHPVPGAVRNPDKVVADTALHTFYKQLISMRKSLQALNGGFTEIVVADALTNILVYKREDSIQTVFVCINNSDATIAFDLEIDLQIPYKEALAPFRSFKPENGTVPVSLEPFSATVLYATEEHAN